MLLFNQSMPSLNCFNILNELTLLLVSQTYTINLSLVVLILMRANRVSPARTGASTAAFQAIVILIRQIWPLSTSSGPLICKLSKLAGIAVPTCQALKSDGLLNPWEEKADAKLESASSRGAPL